MKLNWRFVIAAAAAMAGCEQMGSQPVAELTTVVDSVFPVEEEIRRFKAVRGGASARVLADGAHSRDELVAGFIAALEAQDTAAFANMLLNPSEYIDLYYPSSMYARPPYKQSPELNWFLMQQNSNKGFVRLVRRLSGKQTGYAGYRCAEVRKEGANTLHDRCSVTWALEPRTARIFSTIIEHDGRFKFMSYANDM